LIGKFSLFVQPKDKIRGEVSKGVIFSPTFSSLLSASFPGRRESRNQCGEKNLSHLLTFNGHSPLKESVCVCVKRGRKGEITSFILLGIFPSSGQDQDGKMNSTLFSLYKLN
jgi:hypothetical protein